jgi:hypothetical protein
MGPTQSEFPERLSDLSQRQRQERAKRREKRFVRGPIPLWWVERASRLPGKALAVGMAIWFKSGMTLAGAEVPVTPALVKPFGVTRQAGYRAMRALENVGLIVVSRHRGRCPRVRIVREPPASSDQDC